MISILEALAAVPIPNLTIVCVLVFVLGYHCLWAVQAVMNGIVRSLEALRLPEQEARCGADFRPTVYPATVKCTRPDGHDGYHEVKQP